MKLIVQIAKFVSSSSHKFNWHLGQMKEIFSLNSFDSGLFFWVSDRGLKQAPSEFKMATFSQC